MPKRNVAKCRRSVSSASLPTSLAGDAAAAVDRLDVVVERLGQQAATIATSGPKAASLLQQAAHAARDYGSHADAWQGVSDRLAAQAGEGDCAAAADAAFLARLRNRYTMVSERHIHDGFCGAGEVGIGTAAEEGALQSAANDEAALQDLLF